MKGAIYSNGIDIFIVTTEYLEKYDNKALLKYIIKNNYELVGYGEF